MMVSIFRYLSTMMNAKEVIVGFAKDSRRILDRIYTMLNATAHKLKFIDQLTKGLSNNISPDGPYKR